MCQSDPRCLKAENTFIHMQCIMRIYRKYLSLFQGSCIAHWRAQCSDVICRPRSIDRDEFRLLDFPQRYSSGECTELAAAIPRGLGPHKGYDEGTVHHVSGAYGYRMSIGRTRRDEGSFHVCLFVRRINSGSESSRRPVQSVELRAERRPQTIL